MRGPEKKKKRLKRAWNFAVTSFNHVKIGLISDVVSSGSSLVVVCIYLGYHCLGYIVEPFTATDLTGVVSW